MRTLLTGQQGTPALCPANRAFFYIFYLYFLAGVHFLQKNKKNFIFSLFFLSFSLSFSLLHTLGSFEFNESHRSKM